MSERTDPTIKQNHPFFCQYRAVYEYATQFMQEKRVLDAGCGEGYGAHLLAQHAKEIVAIDRNKKTIVRARQRYSLPNLKFYTQDVEQLGEYPPHSFDVACCLHTIEHLKHPNRFLTNIGKLLSEQGTLLISTPNRHSPFRRATEMEWPYHEKEYTAAEFHELLLSHFKNVQIYALHGNEKIEEFQRRRARYVKQIFKWDILRLRKWLPKRLLQLSFDIGGKLLKFSMNTTCSSLITDITVLDFEITDNRLSSGLDLIGVCRL